MKSGFTLVELMTVMAIIAVLVALVVPGYRWAINQAGATASSTYLRQLVAANWTYAGDHDNCFCPAQDQNNLIRWHGARTSTNGQFDPTQGYLGPYLGGNMVQQDPLFRSHITGSISWEDGSGGYGYNEIYIGGTPQDNFHGVNTLSVTRPDKTIMFATTAFAMGGEGNPVQEYPFCEPPQWVDANNNLAGALQPSVHFRANGKALVGWCDGHVTAEKMNADIGPNYYGGDNTQALIGWFGPTDNNGYWNPNYTGP